MLSTYIWTFLIVRVDKVEVLVTEVRGDKPLAIVEGSLVIKMNVDVGSVGGPVQLVDSMAVSSCSGPFEP